MTPISKIASEALKNLNNTTPDATPVDWLLGLAIFHFDQPNFFGAEQNTCQQTQSEPQQSKPTQNPAPAKTQIETATTPKAPIPKPSGMPTLPDGLTLKPTANIRGLNPELAATFPTIVQVWRDAGVPDPVITSGNDSKHMVGSKHYVGKAIDLRGNNVSDEKMRELAKSLQNAIGPKFRVLTEFFPSNPANDHIHVQLVG